ncbi:hypothetical protein [Chthonobacter albigriseus]|uniref:hypothetical protein n=1 Tax=Chthonobacter albigriseus TaxID=1683161 RepID=UPI0015EEAE58|nr:hypothetical protein [Chthonobacter albigriseus]
MTDAQRERLEYIERMCQELARMAEVGGHKLLSYLLEMAREEAENARTSASVGIQPSAIGMRAPRQRN